MSSASNVAEGSKVNAEVRTPDVKTRSSSLSEQEMLEEEQFRQEFEMETQVFEGEVQVEREEDERPVKRSWDEQSPDWTVVKRKEKKLKPQVDNIEMYISHSKPLPKQFTIARLLLEQSITDVLRVKYVTAYKIRLDVQSEISAERLEFCKAFRDMGWRIQRAMENNTSYGVIRDVDLEMTDENIMSRIKCPEPAVLLSIFRLNRRSAEDGWAASECVRLCFKGAFLPAFVYVDGLRIKVDKYVFPVSQCTRCWKLGHKAKRCPSIKMLCPKCCGEHDNCNTKTFKCVNCGGNHMAMYKGCPAFIKEKKLRNIMAEFNCTYRKALMIYVTPGSPTSEPRPSAPKMRITKPIFFPNNVENSPICQQATPSFSEVVKHTIDVKQEESTKPIHDIPKKIRRQKEEAPFEFGIEIGSPPSQEQAPLAESEENSNNTEEQQKLGRNINFSELLQRLKEIIFLRGASIKSKIKNVLKCCIEWLILVVVDNISDWPILQSVLDFFASYG